MFLVVRAGCVGFVCVIFRCLFGLIGLWYWCVCRCGFCADFGCVGLCGFVDYLLRGVSVVFDLVVSS